MSGKSEEKKSQLQSVQVLRAMAALLVAFGHAQAFIAIPMERLGLNFGRNYLLPWGSGVDLFFVISGFIMVYSSERLYRRPGGVRIFVFRRFARIVPLYWILTCFAVLSGILRHKPGFDAASILMSFLFLPWDTVGAGVPRPVFELGWTLNYEMFFYMLFAGTLAFSREVSALIVVTILAALSLLGWIVQPTEAQAFVWTQPIILEFSFGILLALAARRKVTIPSLLRLVLIGLAVGALCYDLLQSKIQTNAWITPNDIWRVIAWGLPSAALLASATLKTKLTDKTPSVPTRVLALLGDASYALYLCHPIVMSAFSAFWFAAGFNNNFNPWIEVGAALLLSIGAALAVHRFFEVPVTRALQNRALRQNTVKVPAE